MLILDRGLIVGLAPSGALGGESNNQKQKLFLDAVRTNLKIKIHLLPEVLFTVAVNLISWPL